MAAALSRCLVNLVVLFTFTLITVVFTSEFQGNYAVSPSRNNLQVIHLEDSYLDKKDIFNNFHSLQKRAADTPPIKKASASSDKKPFGKSSDVGTVTPYKQSATENTTNVTATNYEFSTIGPVVASNSLNETVSTIASVSVINDDKSTQKPLITPLPNVPDDKTTYKTSSTPEPMKYNVSISTASPNYVLSNVSSTTASSTTTLTSVTTEFPEVPSVLPTRPSNIKNETEDHHIYYNSSVLSENENAMAYWVNFDEIPKDKVVINTMLSHSHRRAATVTLTFDFPFYGHLLRNITIATGGFVYTGDYMHSWLAATQYIAPLMANFDTSLSVDSIVRYFDNGTAFVIEWNEVSLQDEKKGGNFTFQAILLNSGNIVFVYKTIPASVLKIDDVAHPVKVGLSDAYVIDRVIYFIRRKTIYEYHKVDLKMVTIKNNSAIYFTALTTCLSYQDCESCMKAETDLKCIWCAAAKRCSDGLDRQRQDWLNLRCDHEKLDNCSAIPRSDIKPDISPLTDSPTKTYTIYPSSSMPDNQQIIPTYKPGKPSESNDDDGASSSARVAEDTSSMGVGSVVAILLILGIVMGSMVWVGYAYRNPHTFSGQLLIRYRPSQWRFRSGEARYTAASVHM